MKIFPILFLLLFCACQPEKEKLFTVMPSSETGISFQNTVIENDSFNLIDYYYVYNGGGVAVGDINNDGLTDVYFTGNQVADKLYLNLGSTEKSAFKFEDISEKAGIKKGGWSTGVTMADVNGDGLLDIYVCKSGNYPSFQRANQLYINHSSGGKIRFIESAKAYGLADTTFSNQAAFFDFDKDNDLDLFLITSTNSTRNPNALVAPITDGSGLSADKLFQNNGNGTFTDISRKAGVLHDGMSLGLSIADVNEDGWEDIFVGNDFLSYDLLYLNNHDGTFTESAKESFGHHSQFSMGTDVADINNDGKFDIMSVDMIPADNEQRKKMAGPANYVQYEQSLALGYHPQFMRNMLHLNVGKTPDGKVHFSEIAQLAGVHSTDWSWSPLFADFDNDGNKDLFISNGYLRDITDLDFVSYNAEMSQASTSKKEVDDLMKKGALKMNTLKKVNYLFRNNADLTFKDISNDAFGDLPSLSNGAAYADFDNDGDLDLVVNNINQEAFLLKNNTPSKAFLKVKLQGTAQNTFGLGTDVTLFQQGKLQKIHQSVTKGFQSSSDFLIHFGLGINPKIDSLQILWSDGKSQTIKNVKSNQTLIVDYKNAHFNTVSKPNPARIFKDESAIFKDYVHQEEPYMDYNQETLLMHKLSQQGPKMTAGDVNGDGLEDFFVGGSYLHEGKLFIQKPNGKFQQTALTKENQEKNEEDVGVLFFDADSDKDLDLYIVSGSNEYFDGSEYYQDRLFLNNGKGSFTLTKNHLPNIGHSGSCIIANDFDHDGDLDIFRGGRLNPLQYPKAGESYLLKNGGGYFKDITDNSAPNLRTVGMVTSAVWADVDHDSWEDLIVVGECMPITLFQNKQGKLVETNTFPASNGLWNCIKAADFDKDGDIDFVVGNLGTNNRYHFSKQEPLTIYGADYDNNGRWDAIPSYFLKGIEYPIPSRDELVRQIPSFKAKFNTYALYAKATMNDVLSEEQRKAATITKVFLQESIYLENLGNNTFKFKALPNAVQWSVCQDILIEDLNADGNLDMILVGNDYGVEPVAGRYDASFGTVLKGNGKGDFEVLALEKTGFFADGDCKSIISIHHSSTKKSVIVSRNNAALKVLSFDKEHLP